jgi:hypothetical protein
VRSRLLALLPLAAILAACGGSSTGSGTMSVRLVDAPADYKAINLNIVEVSVRSDAAGWVSLGAPDPKTMPVNLLSLTGGVAATLVPGATLPAGDYSQMRLLLGPGNTVVLADDTVHDLKIPSGLQSGLKLVIKVHVDGGGAKDVFIDFDAKHSIFLHAAGGSGQYILRPVIFAREKSTTGTITGRLTSTASENVVPLPGAVVTAQSVDTAGNPTVVRSTRTGADGGYVLDLLPLGASYYVVSQPVVGTSVYLARSSGPIAVTTGAPAVYDAAFTPTAQIGTLSGGVAPAASTSDSDVVAALQTLDAAGASRTLVVRSGMAEVAAGGTESYTFDQLPAASYTAVATRRTLDAQGSETVKTSAPVAATVPAGGTATANLTIP